LFSCFRSIILVVKGNKSISFASIVGVGDSSKLLELCLEFRVGSPFIDSIDKELAALFSVGSHDSQMVVRRARLSLSLKQYHHKPASANPLLVLIG